MKSPNFNERENGAKPAYIILHYTGMKTAAAALERLCDPAAEVSAHYMIDEDGSLTALVDEKKRAWHAGKSYWQGEENMNAVSIGIEIVNPGHAHGYRFFPAEQMQAVMDLCLRIMKKHNIPAQNVLAHSDIAPGRKLDPGELFPWHALALSGIGVWPEILPQDRAGRALSECLEIYGYDPDADPVAVVTAFQRHFHPEIFATPDRVGTDDPETAARARALLRRMASFV